MADKKYVAICPNCGASDFDPAAGKLKNFQPGYTIPNIGSGVIKECNECGFRGTFPEVEEKGIKKLQKEIRRNKGKLLKETSRYTDEKLKDDWKKFNPKLIPLLIIFGSIVFIFGIYSSINNYLWSTFFSLVIGTMFILWGILAYIGKRNNTKD